MKKLHDVTIIKNGEKTIVTVDGMEIKGLKDVNYTGSVDYPATITIEFLVGNLNVDREENNGI